MSNQQIGAETGGAATKTDQCPLCDGIAPTFFEDQRRVYHRCPTCFLIFVPTRFHLSTTDELKVYEQHQNSPSDTRYRNFLSRLFDPLQQRLAAKSCGLDFGSGPGPTLSVMFQEAGHAVDIYDPFYSPDRGPLSRRYDFVTASEVVEHFRVPHTDLNGMWSCVRPGGFLGIMTKLAENHTAFAKWHYKNDPTHISFFSRQTFSWLSAKWGAQLTFVGNDVVLFQRCVEP